MLGLVLIIFGLAMIVEQAFLLLGVIAVISAQVQKVNKISVNWWFGRAGVVLAGVGAVLLFG